MLSLSTIVQVQVNVAEPASSASAFSTGLILASTSEESIPDANRLRLYNSAPDMLSDGFAATDSAYLAAVAYFAASPAPDRVYVGLYTASESPYSALQDILSRSADFYGVCLCTTVTSAVREFIQSAPSLSGRFVAFIPATGSVSTAVSASGTLGLIYETGSSKLLGVYGSDLYSAAAVMGTAMGLSRAYADSSFALCYQQIPGMLPVDLTEAQIATLKEKNANVYIIRGTNRRLFENGSTASGHRFDEVLSLDRITYDLQEAALSLITSGTGRLPQTDETSAVFINRFSAVLSAYASAGILSTSPWRGDATGSLQPGDTVENGFLLWADSYDFQTEADRAAHKAMPIHCALCMTGAVESLLISIDVTM